MKGDEMKKRFWFGSWTGRRWCALTSSVSWRWRGKKRLDICRPWKKMFMQYRPRQQPS